MVAKVDIAHAMMNCLLLSGSVRKGSITVKFLDNVANHFSNITFGRFSLDRLPLFHPDAYDEQISNEVYAFKKGKTHLILICGLTASSISRETVYKTLKSLNL